MSGAIFTKPFTQQEGIPEAGIARAIEIMRSGRLHRYNLTDKDVMIPANLSWNMRAGRGQNTVSPARQVDMPFSLVCGSVASSPAIWCWLTLTLWRPCLGPFTMSVHSRFLSISMIIITSTSTTLRPRRNQVDRNFSCCRICAVILPTWTGLWMYVNATTSA